MWVVYSSPSDYPGQFVARRWEAQEVLARYEELLDVRLSKTAAVPIQLITGAESWGAQASFSF
jgi:hypothetical protein